MCFKKPFRTNIFSCTNFHCNGDRLRWDKPNLAQKKYETYTYHYFDFIFSFIRILRNNLAYVNSKTSIQVLPTTYIELMLHLNHEYVFIISRRQTKIVVRWIANARFFKIKKKNINKHYSFFQNFFQYNFQKKKKSIICFGFSNRTLYFLLYGFVRFLDNYFRQ